MYCVSFHFKNARENGTGEYIVPRSGDEIQKWTLLPAEPSGTELLRLIATACGGTAIVPRLRFPFSGLFNNQDDPLQIELVCSGPIQHGSPGSPGRLWRTGIQMDTHLALRPLKTGDPWLTHSGLTPVRTKTGLGGSWFFLLGYGADPKPHDGTDAFDFSSPFFRLARFHSLFDPNGLLTDPVMLLHRVHLLATRQRRLPSTHFLKVLTHLLPPCLGIDTSGWSEAACDFRQEWQSLASWQRRVLPPLLDAGRHLMDAHPRERTPLDIPTLVLLDRPDQYVPRTQMMRWTTLMDLMLPRAQFLVTLSDGARKALPAALRARSLPLRQPAAPPRKAPVNLPRGTILLVDVDGTLPNLAIMKLSRYFKDDGRPVTLVRHKTRIKDVDAVFASCVFSRPSSRAHVQKLRAAYGEALTVGGSGIDVRGRLPAAVEQLPPDYSLYPELGDRGIGFLTRGCPFHCPFCIVPVKEGQVRQVATLDDLLPDGQRKLILLDDNLLAHPKALDLLEEMAVRGVAVNFTQSLDLRLVDEDKAALLKRIQCSNTRFTRRVYHFSLNDANHLDEVRERYALFNFVPMDNVELICMYGFNTTLAEDVRRFRFLSTLPGAYVFVQRYQPIPGGPPPRLGAFFDERADELIDELIRIVFRQNMKSMECYYCWVSKEYARTFGKLHLGLVDAIFKYNRREMKGLYLATLGNIPRGRSLAGRIGDARIEDFCATGPDGDRME